MSQVVFWANMVEMLHFMSLVGNKYIVTSVSGRNAEVHLIGGEWDAYVSMWDGYGGTSKQGEGEFVKYCTFTG